MKGLNKKLSENIERKIDQLETASLKYILSLSFLGVSLKGYGGLNPFEDTLVIAGLFWLGLSIRKDKRIFTYLFSILSASYFLGHEIFTLGLAFGVLIILSQRIFDFYGLKRNLHLLLTGIIAHIGDLLTTYIGLQKNLSEQNPFLVYLGNFTEISSALIASKLLLFMLVIYGYEGEIEGLDSLLKIFFVAGFILALSNLEAITTGI